MLHLQALLRKGTKPEELEASIGVYCKRHERYPNLVLFKYGIDADFSNQAVLESRGIILDESNNWEVVAFPYKKFWNAHEGNAAVIDWSSARVYEKLDGSLCTLYCYKGEWQVATSGTPDANCSTNNTDKTFYQVFWEVWNELNYPDVNELNQNVCYMFELCTKDNQVVVQHPVRRLVLHGMRNLCQLTYPEIMVNNHTFFECAKSYSLKSLDDCLKAALELNPVQNEGYVVVDGNFNRIKIKSPKYVALHHIKSNFSERRMLELIRLGEVTELLSYFPEMANQLNAMAELHRYLCDTITLEYIEINAMILLEHGDMDCTGSVARKRFAMQAKNSKYRAVLFGIYDGQTVRESLDRLQVDVVIKMMKELK